MSILVQKEKGCTRFYLPPSGDSPLHKMAKGEKRRLDFLSRKVTYLESTIRQQQETIRTLAAALQHQLYSNQLISSFFHTRTEQAFTKLTTCEPTPGFRFTVPAAPVQPERLRALRRRDIRGLPVTLAVHVQDDS